LIGIEKKKTERDLKKINRPPDHTTFSSNVRSIASQKGHHQSFPTSALPSVATLEILTATGVMPF
jgi:hypothetical protein